MRILTLVLIFVLSAATASADPITREQARKKAEAFLAEQHSQQLLAPVENTRKLAPRRGAASVGSEYYVFNKGMMQGFVIVSGDDQTIPVLGYCDQGEFDYEQLPPQLQDLLDDYSRQIQAIRAGAPVHRLPANHPTVEPFMACKWNQNSPYNDLCPLDEGRRSVTGCLATAMAQILYYNREKSVTETQADIPGYTTSTKGIVVPGIAAGAPIDWANMKDTYSSATDLQKKAVAQLMLYCGVALRMDYTNGSSGAYYSLVADAFKNYFGYGNSVKLFTSFSSEDEMDRIVYAEVAAGRPVFLGGHGANANVGHAFLTCGYENQRYYINWGWGGQSDGYYYLTNLTPGDGQGIGGNADGFNYDKLCVIGLEPENFGEKTMSFSDATVSRICIEKWDADGNGRLTYNEAAAVTSLGEAFKGQVTIKKFPELYYFTSLTTLDAHAFNGCRQLADIRLPKTLKTIGDGAFKDCIQLTQVILPSGVEDIGAAAFDGCKSVAYMELPVGITEIKEQTFRGCASITTVDLPINVRLIGAEAYSGCTKLNSFTVHTYSPSKLQLQDGVFSDVDLSTAKLHVKQGTKSFFAAADQWKDFGTIIQTRDISAGKFTKMEPGHTYYIYNLGTGSYLTKGEAYKTQAVVGDAPMRFKVVHPASQPDNIFYLTSPDTGKNGTYLFRTSTDGNVGEGVKATFVDGESLSENAFWSITAAADNVYYIQKPNPASEQEQHQFLGIQTDHASDAASPTYGAYWDVDDSKANNCLWQFVLYDEAQALNYTEAVTLEKLLATAKKRNVRHEDEQAVFDNLESSNEELKAAQSTLRKKLKYVDFYHREAFEACVNNFDSDTDGEISYKEASEVEDFGWLFYFKNNTKLVHFDELQYFTNAKAIHGNFLEGCVNLETVVLPPSLDKIYYWAFKGCKKLQAIIIPEFVSQLGEQAFAGCTSLREVSVGAPDPSFIQLGTDVFSNVPLSECTLKVPYGSKALYEQAPVWKDFGQIVEVRGSAQPKTSPVMSNVTGYVMNVATRKFITVGEAYGTQSVVARNGKPYQLRRSASMPEGVYYLESDGQYLFRTTYDAKVGIGVKACFGDGSFSANAYWTVVPYDDNTFTLQVPKTDASYVEDEYLGVDENHDSDFASPTYGLYWDVKGSGTRWAFVTSDDMKASQDFNDALSLLADMLKRANEASIDVKQEQAVYDDIQSSLDDVRTAVVSLRQKLHYIDFVDAKAQTLSLAQWDTNYDDELSQEEAAAVTDIGTVFSNANNLKSLEDLRYFTSLTAIPEEAFKGSTSLHTVYLPENVTAIGKYAFQQSAVKNIVVLNDKTLVPMGLSGVASNTLVFVPAAMLETYKADKSWPERSTIVEYTGVPTVSAEASRIYGRNIATIKVTVTGAPIEGEAFTECEAIADKTLPVGQYPITVLPGTIITDNVDYREGVLTIEPAPLTITAKSYTRYVGEPNPAFEVTFSTFRNKETDTVLTVRPIVTCEATPDSPAGEYEIVVSGAEARNYTFKYVAGKLTVIDNPDAVEALKTDGSVQPLYDLQGRRVGAPQRGIYVRDRRKIVVK